jgi:hypothetical protein
MTTAEQETYRGLNIEIYYDDDSANDPRDWPNVSVMVCWHRRANLGDEQVDLDFVRSEFGDKPESAIRTWLVSEYDALPNSIMPLYLYEHSGMTICTGPFNDPFDSGQVGFVFATERTMRECCGDDWRTKGHYSRGGKVWWKTVRETIDAEVKTYDSFLRGEVYYFVVEDFEGNVLDSCGGFVGEIEYCLSEAKSNADYHADERDKRIEEARAQSGRAIFTGMVSE